MTDRGGAAILFYILYFQLLDYSSNCKENSLPMYPIKTKKERKSGSVRFCKPIFAVMVIQCYVALNIKEKEMYIWN